MPEQLKVYFNNTTPDTTPSGQYFSVIIQYPDSGLYDPNHDKFVEIDKSILKLPFFVIDEGIYSVNDTWLNILSQDFRQVRCVGLYFYLFEYYKTLKGTEAEKIVEFLEYGKQYWRQQNIWSSVQDKQLAEFKMKYAKNLNITPEDWSSLI